MEPLVLTLLFEGGALYVHKDHMVISVDDDYYNGSFTKEQMRALRTVLNRLELPEDVTT